VESDESYNSYASFDAPLFAAHDGDITIVRMFVEREPVLADATFQYKERRMFALITARILCAIIETLQMI